MILLVKLDILQVQQNVKVKKLGAQGSSSSSSRVSDYHYHSYYHYYYFLNDSQV